MAILSGNSQSLMGGSGGRSGGQMMWRGEVFSAALDREVASRQIRAAWKLRDTIKKNLSVPGPARSQPGEYPRKQTGFLQRSVLVRTRNRKGEGGYCTIWVEAPYGFFLEHGTSKMAARPFFDRSIQSILTELQDIYGEAIHW